MNASYYLLSFMEGILTFVSPCLLPMLPIYVFYLAGVPDPGNMSENRSKARLLTNSIGFVVGFTVVFVLLGAGATALGHFMKGHLDFFFKISGIIMILLGFHFIGLFQWSFLDMEKRLEYNFKQLRLFSSIVFGMVFAIGWSPCTGSYLFAAISMAGKSETLLEGISLLLVYSAGLGIPFILTAVIFEQIKGALKFLQRHTRIIQILSGMVLILVGILFLTDKLNYLGIFY